MPPFLFGVNMIIYVKPNGTEVLVNSENDKAARELGWVPKAELEAALKESNLEEPKEEPKRRGRPPKG